MFLFMKEYVSFHHPIIWTGLKILSQCSSKLRLWSIFFNSHNGIQGTKPPGRKCNQLIDAVVKIMKYKKTKIDHAIYIKVLFDGTESYLTVYTDDVLITTSNETKFTEQRKLFEEDSEIKFQE